MPFNYYKKAWYYADGTGRDSFIARDPEMVYGKYYASKRAFVTAPMAITGPNLNGTQTNRTPRSTTTTTTTTNSNSQEKKKLSASHSARTTTMTKEKQAELEESIPDSPWEQNNYYATQQALRASTMKGGHWRYDVRLEKNPDVSTNRITKMISAGEVPKTFQNDSIRNSKKSCNNGHQKNDKNESTNENAVCDTPRRYSPSTILSPIAKPSNENNENVNTLNQSGHEKYISSQLNRMNTTYRHDFISPREQALV